MLRWPLGLEFTDAELVAETDDLHITVMDGKLALACLMLTPLANGQIKMRQVAVDPALQGTGIGRQMVEFSETEAARLGYQEMVLHARDTAVGFYLRLGYESVGDPFKEVGIPHRYMRKSLTSSSLD